MRERFGRQSGLLGGLVLAAVIGLSVALVASSASTSVLLSATRRPAAARTAPATTAPPVRATPSPALTQPGQLRPPVSVALAGSVVVADGRKAVVLDSGSTRTIAPPLDAQGIALSVKSPTRAIAGGNGIRYTDDGGLNWRSPKAQPPLPGGFVPLLIDPDDPDVWFFQHGTRLLRTRDAGASWRELTGIPTLAAPAMAPGARADEEVLWDGTIAVLLDDNGQQVTVRQNAPAPLRSAAVLGGDVVAAAADGSVYRANASGWTRTSGTGLVVAGAGGRVWVGDGGPAMGRPGAVGVTADGGPGTWTQATGLPSDQPVVGIGSDRAGSEVIAYCLGGDLYRSSDGGKTFALASSVLRS